MSTEPFFTSNRERRLWLGAMVVVLAIWSTLGLAGTLAKTLRSYNLLEAAFALGFLMTLGVITGGSLKRFSGREWWALLGIGIAYGMVMVRMGLTLEERTHLFEYGLVALLIYRGLEERVNGGRRVPVPAVTAVVITGLLGWIDEGIQAVLPSRVYDIRDVFFNTLAGIMAVGATLVLALAERKAAPGSER